MVVCIFFVHNRACVDPSAKVQRNYGSFLSKSDLHVMIKKKMLAQSCPKGKEPILTMAMQMAGGGWGLSNGHFLCAKWDSCFEKQF